MNFKKVLPAVALAVGVTAQMTAHAELFQMNEVSGHGLQVAHDAADDKCGAGSCGAAKPSEKKEANAANVTKEAEHKCAVDKNGEHKCGADKKTCKHDKNDAHKCGADKNGEHKCGAADKKTDKKDKKKGDDHKCGAAGCGAQHKNDAKKP